MDRVTPNTRLRFMQDGDLLDNSNQVTMTDFIEIITDTFYDGGAKPPSMPSIPLAFAANMNSDSIQLLQVNEMYGDYLESVYTDTGPPWTNLDHQKSFSQISLDNIPNDYFVHLDGFSSKITPVELAVSYTHLTLPTKA